MVLDSLTVRETLGTLQWFHLLHRLDEPGVVPGVAGQHPGVVEPGQEPGQAAQQGGGSLYEALQDTVVEAVGTEQLQFPLGRKGTTSLVFCNFLDVLISTAK